MATATPILDPPGGGSGGGFTPGATQRVPFGDAPGTALTDSANLTYNPTLYQLVGRGGGAKVRLDDITGGSLFYADGAGITTDASTGHFFTGGVPGAGEVAKWNATKFETTAGIDLAVGATAIATNATTGFLQFPTCAGTPTGAAPERSAVVDSTNHLLYVRLNAAWKVVTVT